MKSDPALETPSTTRDRRFWTMRVKPMEKITIGKSFGPCHMIVQNHGPGRIGVYAGYGDRIVLEPGQLRLTYAYIGLFVENKDKKSSLIEMEFMPAFR